MPKSKTDNRTIAITLRFWTNNLNVNTSSGKKISCWDSGRAIGEKNETKAINSFNEPFNCFEDILPLLKEFFRKNKVLVVSSNQRPRVLSHRRKSS